MSESPYKSPETSNYQSDDLGREPVRRVARYQRFVIFALLANLLANIILFATFGQNWPVRLVAIALSLGVAVFAVVAIFLLAKEVINTGAGVICAVLMLVPCISLIVLLVVNQTATSYLQKNGVHVGFFGTNPDAI